MGISPKEGYPFYTPIFPRNTKPKTLIELRVDNSGLLNPKP